MRRLPQGHRSVAVPHQHGADLAGRCYPATPGELFRDARGGTGACDRVRAQENRPEPAISSANARAAALDFPVETMVGGERHGISFLFRVPALEGLPLPRARLLEARYFHYAEQNRLALSLGFPEEKPSTYETALGRVLTPYLEKRCLSCHGAPRTHGTRVETGVACENCHGPGQSHLAALGAHSRDLGILNPNKLPVAERMRPCSQCHAGSSVVEDPMPDDTLISDQVTALKNSECWRQSAGEITCTNCHDPHRDAPRPVLVARSEKTCLRCHSATVTNHAGLCPVNRITGCVGCHMPNETRGAFVIAEHWIRVHPEQKIKVAAHNPAWRTTITPKHLYLRMIVLDDGQKRRQSGSSFYREDLSSNLPGPIRSTAARESMAAIWGISTTKPARSGVVRGSAEAPARRDLRCRRSKRKVRHASAHAAEFPRGC